MFLVPVTRSSSELARNFDRLFDDGFLDRFFGGTSGSEPALRSPSLDVAETESGYKVAIDLPGVAKEDVKITIDGRRVSVSAQTQREDVMLLDLDSIRTTCSRVRSERIRATR